MVLQAKGEPEIPAQGHLLPCTEKDCVSEVVGEVFSLM